MGRKPNLTSSIYEGKDGYWHGRVTVGIKDDGRPDRRHVMGKTETIVKAKVRELEKARDNGKIRKAGERWTVKSWLEHWVEHIAAPTVKENTLAGYRVAVRVHLVPGIGGHRLERLRPEHLERLYAKMMANGKAAATAHQAHRTIRTALNVAVKRGYLHINPASLAKPPRLSGDEIEPYTVDEVRALMEAAKSTRHSARWAIALALGLRQGEALGLRWSDIDLRTGALTVRRSRLRPRWAHGCEEKPCGRKVAGHCPSRRALRPPTSTTKTSHARRTIGLPPQLASLLREHLTEQERAAEDAGEEWTNDRWVFTSPTGGPVNPRTDYTEWKALLKAAGLRDGRLHDARHTAATVLLILGVPERAVMGIMGWSNTTMAARYQHMTGLVRENVAKQIGGLLWADVDPADDGEKGDSTPN